MKNRPRLLCLELGSTEAGRRVIEELRQMIPGIWIAGVEKQQFYTKSVFDTVITTQIDAFLGRYEAVNMSALSMSPELTSLIAPHEGKILNLLGLAGARSVSDYPTPLHGVPVYKDSYDARKGLFNRHCQFWNYVLDNYNIDAVIHENLGQEGYDYTALQVARVKDIPTLVFNITGQFPRVLFVQEDELGLGKLDFGSALKAGIGTSLYPEDPNFIRRSISTTQVSPDAGLKGDYSRYQTSPVASWLFDRSIYKNQLSIFTIIVAVLRKIKRFSLDPRGSLRTVKRSRELLRSTRRSLQEESAYAIAPNLQPNYIYFPLHFQPETSSSIKARGFYRLREAVAFLASALPVDWRIIVKEHPHQFRRLLLREPGFYAQIAAIPNVELVHHRSQNSELVHHARAIACVSHSSITAHAVMAKIPVISLGESHFREAPNYFCVQSSDDLRDAMNVITKQMDSVGISDFDNFLDRLEKSTFEGEFGEQFNDVSDEEWERTLLVTQKNISQVIGAWLRLRGLIAQ